MSSKEEEMRMSEVGGQKRKRRTRAEIVPHLAPGNDKGT